MRTPGHSMKELIREVETNIGLSDQDDVTYKIMIQLINRTEGQVKNQVRDQVRWQVEDQLRRDQWGQL